MKDYELDRVVKLEGTDYDRRRKLKNKDIAHIRKMHADGYGVSMLAKLYDVTQSTIAYHLTDAAKIEANKRRCAYGYSAFDSTAQRISRIAYKKSIISGAV